MKKILPFLIVIGMAIAFLYACGETDSVTYDTTPVQTITPTYPNGTDINVGGSGEGTTGGTTDPTDNGSGGDDGVDILNLLTVGKACNFIGMSKDAMCLRQESSLNSADSKTYCYGYNGNGILANPVFEKNDLRFGDNASYLTGVDMTSIFGSNPTQFDCNETHCGATEYAGKALFWGSDATVNDSVAYGTASYLGTRQTTIIGTDNYTTRKAVSGRMHSCVLTGENKLSCFGYGGNGQLGVGRGTTTINKEELYAPNGDAESAWTDIIDVAAGSWHTAVIRKAPEASSGTVWITGRNAYGEGGYLEPFTNINTEWFETSIKNAIQVTAGVNNTCVLTEVGDVLCSGANHNGVPGNNLTEGSSNWTKVQNVSAARWIAMGEAALYIITHDQKLYSTGSNKKRQSGVESSTDEYHYYARDTGRRNVTDVAANGQNVCVRIGDGIEAKFKCAGQGAYGSRGDGSTVESAVWTDVVIPSGTNAPVDPDPDTVGMPTNINATEITSTSMRFNWTGPTPTATTTDGETVEKYNFQICSDPAGNCVLDPVTGYGTGNYRGTVTSLPQVTMAVNGIDPNTDVHVRVQSISKSGVVSDWTAEFIQKTLP